MEEGGGIGKFEVGIFLLEKGVEFFEFGFQEGCDSRICHQVAEVGGGDLVVIEVHGGIIHYFWVDLKTMEAGRLYKMRESA